jgi:hypothetical protein
MSERQSATLQGTVEKIMKSPSRCEPGRAEILIEGWITRIRRFASRTRSPTKTAKRCT